MTAPNLAALRQELIAERKKPTPERVLAWAWLCEFGLCKWAAPSKAQLLANEKPSPGAKAVTVWITRRTK